ncbi:DsbA family protein [Shimia biformata]|uniref:DsbA family protein n=1 Tax=Shimia biformata TaxID=1294299 RepID=UPI001951030C|nr:DsbA family protein [Shimia biformata]
MNRLLPIALVVLVALAGGIWWVSQPATTSAGVELPAFGAAQASESSVEVTEMVLGSEDAPVTMIEYASFTCPHCASFHQNVFKQLKADYIDTGKVRFIYRDVYFDKFGLWAAMVARCGGEEKFFGISDLLYKSQSEWSRAGDPVAIADSLRKIGRLAGLTDDQLNSCLTDEAKAKTLVGWYQENVAKDDISGTPSFVINGKKHSNMSYDEMKSLLDPLVDG